MPKPGKMLSSAFGCSQLLDNQGYRTIQFGNESTTSRVMTDKCAVPTGNFCVLMSPGAAAQSRSSVELNRINCPVSLSQLLTPDSFGRYHPHSHSEQRAALRV